MKKASREKKKFFTLFRQASTGYFDYFLVFIFFVFSTWLMYKSLSYNPATSTLFIARNEIGDFGLHLGLIQSFALGNNFPPELPFFPGQPLPYHYFFDLLVGLLVKSGIRIDTAFNGLSVVCFSALLFLLYKFPQLLFGKSKLLGILSVLLFIFPSSFTFIDFFRTSKFDPSILMHLWKLPDYVHKGPFDGSFISIFFTLNVYLNQRHLIMALAISLSLLYFLVQRLLSNKSISPRLLFLLGILFGFTSKIHTLIFFGTFIVIIFLSFLYKKYKQLLLLIPAGILFLLQIHDIVLNKTSHPYLTFGFLSGQPFLISNFLLFWLLNIGIALFLIPVGVYISGKKQKLFFLSLLPLFILPNIIQFSYRIDHNHSLFNFFFIFTNFYVAFVLMQLFARKLAWKILAIILFFFLTISGIINLMPIKNDYHYPYVTNPHNSFMQWIVKQTDPHSVFLEKSDLLDPVVLSGRKNYFGNAYYLTVMGYPLSVRSENTKKYFDASDMSTIRNAKKEGIRYMVIPLKYVVDFPYTPNKKFLEENLSVVYRDEDIEVFAL